jgi:hypothetical protein
LLLWILLPYKINFFVGSCRMYLVVKNSV